MMLQKQKQQLPNLICGLEVGVGWWRNHCGIFCAWEVVTDLHVVQRRALTYHYLVGLLPGLVHW